MNIEDRVVQRAIKQIVEPLLDPWFSDNSYGYRPRRDRRHALACAEALTLSEGRSVWLVEDIENAFDQVPRGRLLDVLRRTLPANVVELIQLVVDGRGKRGIPQGSPLSPLMLNVYLDHFVDRPWQKRFPNLPLLRTADDVLVLCRSKDEALEAYEQLRGLLDPAGMPLKGNVQSSLRDLGRGDRAEWLGYNVELADSELIVNLGTRMWTSLNERLVRAHEKPNSPLVARDAIAGWIEQAGPCYGLADMEAAYGRIATIAGSLAFNEVQSPDEMATAWEQSHQRWLEIRRRNESRSYNSQNNCENQRQ